MESPCIQFWQESTLNCEEKFAGTWWPNQWRSSYPNPLHGVHLFQMMVLDDEGYKETNELLFDGKDSRFFGNGQSQAIITI
jgi:hypothetical protein